MQEFLSLLINKEEFFFAVEKRCMMGSLSRVVLLLQGAIEIFSQNLPPSPPPSKVKCLPRSLALQKYVFLFVCLCMNVCSFVYKCVFAWAVCVPR